VHTPAKTNNQWFGGTRSVGGRSDSWLSAP